MKKLLLACVVTFAGFSATAGTSYAGTSDAMQNSKYCRDYTVDPICWGPNTTETQPIKIATTRNIAAASQTRYCRDSASANDPVCQSKVIYEAGLPAAETAETPEPVTAGNGMTLYVFDKDVDGQSACYDACAKKWPPYAAKAVDQRLPDNWKLAERTDGTKQWTYDGKPVYFFAGDKAEGEANGDGAGGVWHVVVK
jgi:predicted lipoprotein with Yx(FWY)xxD motif